MKYKGKKLEGRNTDILVLKKGNETIVFRAEALENYREFDKVCKAPVAPQILRPGGIRAPNEKDSKYLERQNGYAEKRLNYMMIRSLVDISCYSGDDKNNTEKLEWETVDINNPDTYGNWQTELEDAGFSEMERMRVMVLCTQVNALDDNLLEIAKEDFLAEAPLQEE
jgi:hypothetical protein